MKTALMPLTRVRGDVTHDEFFYQRINGQQVGVLGWVSGADTALAAPLNHESVKAVMPMSAGLSDRDLGVPMFLLTGTRDFRESSTRNTFTQNPTKPRYLADIEDAGHASFAQWCSRIEFMKANKAPQPLIDRYEAASADACTPQNIHNDDAVALTDFYAVSFFKTHVAGQPEYEQYLSAEFARASGLPVEIQRVPDLSSQLQAGDADQDLKFDQLDLVQFQIAATYLTGRPATWGVGDWNGAPGGSPGSPPAGDGLFNQRDIVAAQQAGLYLTGSYAAVMKGGPEDYGRASIGYDNNISKAGSVDSFDRLGFVNVAQGGLSDDFVLDDLAVIGSLEGGGELGDADLIYIPEPSSVVLLAVGLFAAATRNLRVRASYRAT